MNLDCPNCGSQQTQKLSLAVEGGTFSNESVSLGAGLASGGLGLGAASTKGKSTSKFAEKNAAPEKLPPFGTFLAVMFLSALTAIFTGMIAIQIGFWIGILAVILCVVNNVKSFPREMSEWNAKYLCHRCSTIYTPDASQPVALNQMD